MKAKRDFCQLRRSVPDAPQGCHREWKARRYTKKEVFSKRDDKVKTKRDGCQLPVPDAPQGRRRESNQQKIMVLRIELGEEKPKRPTTRTTANSVEWNEDRSRR
jgi:hypothetical protein